MSDGYRKIEFGPARSQRIKKMIAWLTAGKKVINKNWQLVGNQAFLEGGERCSAILTEKNERAPKGVLILQIAKVDRGYDILSHKEEELIEAASRCGVPWLKITRPQTVQGALAKIAAPLIWLAQSRGSSWAKADAARVFRALQSPYEHRALDWGFFWSGANVQEVITRALITYNPVRHTQKVIHRLELAGYGEGVVRLRKEVSDLGGLLAIQKLFKKECGKDVARAKELMVSRAFIHLAESGGPTEQDDKDSKCYDRVMSVVYRLCGGKGEVKIYKSTGAQLAAIKAAPPEEAIGLLTSKNIIVAGMAAAALS